MGCNLTGEIDQMGPASLPFELPRVAVVITSYNYRPYVEDAIRSVLAQTYQRWECVIVDDASTDGSAEHIRQLLETIGDPRLRQMARARNGGQFEAFRDGFAATDAPFVTFLDSDDIWLPNFLLAHISAHLNATHSAALSSSDLFLVDGGRAVLSGTYLALRKPRPDTNSSALTVAPHDQLAAMAAEIDYPAHHAITYMDPYVFGWIWAPASSMLFRRGALEPVMAYPFKSRIGTDYLAATCSHFAGGSLLLSECLGLYRLHGDNYSSQTAFTGGNIEHMPSFKRAMQILGGEVVDFVLANEQRLTAANGRDFVRSFLAHHVDEFKALASDPRVIPFLPGDRRRLRKRLTKTLRHWFGGSRD